MYVGVRETECMCAHLHFSILVDLFPMFQYPYFLICYKNEIEYVNMFSKISSLKECFWFIYQIFVSQKPMTFTKNILFFPLDYA